MKLSFGKPVNKGVGELLVLPPQLKKPQAPVYRTCGFLATITRTQFGQYSYTLLAIRKQRKKNVSFNKTK